MEEKARGREERSHTVRGRNGRSGATRFEDVTGRAEQTVRGRDERGPLHLDPPNERRDCARLLLLTRALADAAETAVDAAAALAGEEQRDEHQQRRSVQHVAQSGIVP